MKYNQMNDKNGDVAMNTEKKIQLRSCSLVYFYVFDQSLLHAIS